jgi:hypothetical protein
VFRLAISRRQGICRKARGRTCPKDDVMRRRPKGPLTTPVSPDDPAVLPQPERAELQRQGAKAAARGDKASSNPMNEPPNLPAATGESTDTWQQRQEAWQHGHETQSETSDPTAPAPASRETRPAR